LCEREGLPNRCMRLAARRILREGIWPRYADRNPLRDALRRLGCRLALARLSILMFEWLSPLCQFLCHSPVVCSFTSRARLRLNRSLEDNVDFAADWCPLISLQLLADFTSLRHIQPCAYPNRTWHLHPGPIKTLRGVSLSTDIAWPMLARLQGWLRGFAILSLPSLFGLVSTDPILQSPPWKFAFLSSSKAPAGILK
jgi:hypothetical protein